MKMMKVTLRQTFLQVLQLTLSISFHHSYVIWWTNNRPTGGSNSETSPYSTDMNTATITGNVVALQKMTDNLVTGKNISREWQFMQQSQLQHYIHSSSLHTYHISSPHFLTLFKKLKW
jgi:hypothetical protein